MCGDMSSPAGHSLSPAQPRATPHGAGATDQPPENGVLCPPRGWERAHRPTPESETIRWRRARDQDENDRMCVSACVRVTRRHNVVAARHAPPACELTQHA